MIKADAKMDDGGARIIAQEIQALDDMRSEKRGGKAIMHMKDTKQIERLKVALGEAGERGLAVLIYVPLSKQLVKVKVPGKYDINPQALADIQAIPSLEKVEWL